MNHAVNLSPVARFFSVNTVRCEWGRDIDWAAVSWQHAQLIRVSTVRVSRGRIRGGIVVARIGVSGRLARAARALVTVAFTAIIRVKSVISALICSIKVSSLRIRVAITHEIAILAGVCLRNTYFARGAGLTFFATAKRANAKQCTGKENHPTVALHNVFSICRINAAVYRWGLKPALN